MIINLTQHPASPEQIAQGVKNLHGDELAELKALLTIGELPSPDEIRDRAYDIAALVSSNGLGDDEEDPFFTHAMIGGAPYLMPSLERALRDVSVIPLYAFTRREAIEALQPDGTVRKTAVFRHLGFVEGVV